jgi:hypothetical protein
LFGVNNEETYLVIPMLPAAVHFRVAIPSVEGSAEEAIIGPRELKVRHFMSVNSQVIEDEGFAGQRRRLFCVRVSKSEKRC